MPLQMQREGGREGGRVLKDMHFILTIPLWGHLDKWEGKLKDMF